jgi:hypothetical protein
LLIVEIDVSDDLVFSMESVHGFIGKFVAMTASPKWNQIACQLLDVTS